MQRSPEETARGTAARRRAALGLGCLLVVVLGAASWRLTANQQLSSDGKEIALQSRALADDGTLALDAYRGQLNETRVRVGAGGHLFSKYGIGYPLLTAAATRVARALPGGGRVDDRRIFAFFNPFLFSLSAVALALLLRQAGAPGGMIVLVTAGYLLSTQATYYAARHWVSNLPTGAVIFLSFFFLWTALEQDRPAAWRLALCGALLGFAGLMRGFPFLVVPVYAAAIAHRAWGAPTSGAGLRRKLSGLTRPTLAFLLPVAVFVCAHLVADHLRTGGGTAYRGEVFGFSTPLLIGFAGNLLWPGKSFLFFYPLAALAPFGLYRFYRRSPSGCFVAVSVVLIHLIGYSKWWAWYGGSNVGTRFWLPALPFLVFPVAFVRGRTLRAVALLLVVAGMYTQARMYPHEMGPVFRSIYRVYPNRESSDAVERVLREDPGGVIRATFVDRVFFRALDRLEAGATDADPPDRSERPPP